MIDLHNQADQLVYQTEKQIEEFKEKLNKDTISNLNQAKEKLVESNKGDDIEVIRADIDSLNKIWSEASEKMYKESAEKNQEETSSDPATNSESDSEIKDADYEVVDDEKE